MLKTLFSCLFAALVPFRALEESPGGETTTDTGGGDSASLRGDLAAAWDASAGETETDKTATTGDDKTGTKPAPKPDVSEAARTLAQSRAGRGTETAPDKTGAPDAAVAASRRTAELAAMAPEDRARAEIEDQQKAAAAATEAPQHWPAKDREFFAKQGPEVKTWLMSRHKAMEADYTRRSQEVAHVRREADELREIFKPFSEAMASDGMTIPMAVRQLTAAHHALIKDPAQGIQWLAGKYGIDLKQIVEGGTQAGQPDPNVKRLEDRLAQLEGNTQRSAQHQQEQERNANLSKVEQFAEEQDAQGKPLRPHFDDVAKDISMLLRAARESGDSLSLQDAYDRAIYANPAVRQKVLAAQDAERRVREDEERKVKANAARTAGFDVKGEGAATSVAAQPNSLRGDLEAAWDATSGRV